MSLINYDQGRIAQSENGPTSLTVALGGTMNLSQLNYFKKLAEVLHYTRAAQELFITQPTLSGAISSLEKELGAPLFERNGRSVLLTPYGEVFYEHVCLALRAIDDGVAAVSARSSASFGTVNLGTTFPPQDHYLPSLIRDFEEAFDKRVIVKVSQGFTNYLTEQLHRGTLDVAFCGKRDNEPDIAYFPVKHCELALYVRDDHPLASADTITFAELNEVDLHTYRRGTPIGERVAKMLGQEFLRGATMERLDAIRDEISDEDYRRARFVIGEERRVLDVCDALQRGDYATVGERMYATHEGLSKDYEVSCEELDFLVDVARECGVTGARMMGGGFGGCTINLVKDDLFADFIATAKRKFTERFGHEPKVYPVVISDGAHKID